MSDPEVKAIVIDVDSPGGTSPGIPELGREIYEARGAKGEGNIVAVANSLAASGALWLSTAFERFMVTPSGEAGYVFRLRYTAQRVLVPYLIEMSHFAIIDLPIVSP